MRVRIRNKYNDIQSITAHLPATPLELYDMLDKVGADNKYCNVYMNIDDERVPKIMCEGGFYDDIFKLNLLAQRLDELPPANTAGFTAVLYDHEDYSLDDVLLVTYGLDAYPIYPCKNYAELGEIVIENDMIPEVENCPDELIEHLDKESIGRLAAERFKGVFVNGYYCEVTDYEPPDMKITISKPDRNEFLLLIGTEEKKAQWYALPYIGNLTQKQVYCIRSPLPNVKTVDALSKLNEVAEKVAQLDNDDLVKLKAVMENNYYQGAGGALMALDELDRYQFDRNIRNTEDYAGKYLRRLLPDDFDMSVLSSDYLYTVGSKILSLKGGSMTSYGALSGPGQELYSAITAQNDDEELDEECEEGMGAIQ